jgi:AraC family transcriptional regulator, arabinose operon regulatory protein
MTPSRPITPHKDVDRLFTGHFVTGPGYEAYRPKGTNDYLLIYTLAGLGRFRTVDGREHLFQPHQLALCVPGTYHDYGVESTRAHWELIWTHFQPRSEWLDLLHWQEIEPGLMRLTVPDPDTQTQLIAQFRRVHESAMSSGPLRDRIAMNALEGLLLMCEQINPNRSQHTVDHRIRQAMDHVTRHLDQKLTLDRLSDLTGLSSSRLGHLFREVVGIAPMEFVERQRIERARQLLTMTSLSIKEISRQVGYETQFYFSLRFKRQTGQSPRAYREAYA